MAPRTSSCGMFKFRDRRSQWLLDLPRLACLASVNTADRSLGLVQIGVEVIILIT